MQVLLLTKEGCVPCRRVKRILGEMQAKIAVFTLEELDYTSERGLGLAREHGVLYPPAVFVEGKLVAKGKIYAQELEAALQACMPAGPG